MCPKQSKHSVFEGGRESRKKRGGEAGEEEFILGGQDEGRWVESRVESF